MCHCSCSLSFSRRGANLVDGLGQIHTAGATSISDFERRQPHRAARSTPPLPQCASGRIGQNQARTTCADLQRVPHRSSGRTPRTSRRYLTTEGQRQVEKGLSSCIAVCLSRVSAECRPTHESEPARMGGGAQVDKSPSFRSPCKTRPPHRCPSVHTPPLPPFSA